MSTSVNRVSSISLEQEFELIASLSKEYKVAIDYLDQQSIEFRICTTNVLEFVLEGKTFTYSFKSHKWKQNGKGKWYPSRTVRDTVEKIRSNSRKKDRLPIYGISDIENNGLKIHTTYSIESAKQLGSYTAYKLKDRDTYLWSNAGLDAVVQYDKDFMLVPICSLSNKKEYMATHFVNKKSIKGKKKEKSVSTSTTISKEDMHFCEQSEQPY